MVDTKLTYISGKVYVQIVGKKMGNVVLVDAQRLADGVEGNALREIVFVAVFEYSLYARHIQFTSGYQPTYLCTFSENQSEKHFSQSKSVVQVGFCAGYPV